MDSVVRRAGALRPCRRTLAPSIVAVYLKGIERRDSCRRGRLRTKWFEGKFFDRWLSTVRRSFLCCAVGMGIFFCDFPEDVSFVWPHYVKARRSFGTTLARASLARSAATNIPIPAGPAGCMKGFNVFQKAVHRVPTLALYRSLLKLSAHSSIDSELSSRVAQKVRFEFRKNRKCYSPRLVKGYLIQAFEVPSRLAVLI